MGMHLYTLVVVHFQVVFEAIVRLQVMVFLAGWFQKGLVRRRAETLKV
jgi:hypothetical protein